MIAAEAKRNAELAVQSKKFIRAVDSLKSLTAHSPVVELAAADFEMAGEILFGEKI
jgi:hypothetical protein